MRITTKGRYALRAVLALANNSVDGKPVSIKSISELENISAEFLEQIFFRLRKSGVISSVRGPGGGFYFTRPLTDISLLEVLTASGEGMDISPCTCGKKVTCDRSGECSAQYIWQEFSAHLKDFASSRSIADMVAGGKQG